MTMTTADPKTVEFVTAFPGFSLPLDLIVPAPCRCRQTGPA
ncbi:MAG: hypothetical protein Q8O42_05185 [Acidobacteriota bacterium]|nr:hypothetical protein [Acidobacteriota bacterium]